MRRLPFAYSAIRGPASTTRTPGMLARDAPIPLAERDVRHLVAVSRESLGQSSVEALGPADGVRVQAVVDDADPHADQGQ